MISDLNYTNVMFKKIFFTVLAFVFGFLASFFVLRYLGNVGIGEEVTNRIEKSLLQAGVDSKKEVIGFLPFWLLPKAKDDYFQYINNLSVFSFVVGPDGSIKKFEKPTEGEPGYFSLLNGKFDNNIKIAKKHDMKLSLVLFSGNDEDIDAMIDNPTLSATNLTSEVISIAKKYGFDELNLDIEKVTDSSAEAQLKFKDFVSKVREETNKNSLSLTIDVTASSFIKTTNLVDPKNISDYVDKVIIMAYDYHYTGSSVTGPVAPETGGGVVSEYDVETAVKEAIKITDPKKIILGIPLYGYEWESISGFPRSATIPSSGLIISNKRAEEFLQGCASCEAEFDQTDKEMHVIYKDSDSGFYHQIFYPEITAMRSKLDLVKKYDLGGVALWALGYEGDTILEPLSAWSR